MTSCKSFDHLRATNRCIYHQKGSPWIVNAMLKSRMLVRVVQLPHTLNRSQADKHGLPSNMNGLAHSIFIHAMSSTHLFSTMFQGLAYYYSIPESLQPHVLIDLQTKLCLILTCLSHHHLSLYYAYRSIFFELLPTTYFLLRALHPFALHSVTLQQCVLYLPISPPSLQNVLFSLSSLPPSLNMSSFLVKGSQTSSSTRTTILAYSWCERVQRKESEKSKMRKSKRIERANEDKDNV